VRVIAERAGITEPHFYHYFRSKDEVYRLAVLEPFDDLAGSLAEEMRELAERSDIDRSELLRHFHQLLLGHVVAVAPLIGAAIFGAGDSTVFYGELLARVRPVMAKLVEDLPRLGPSLDVDVVTRALVGAYLGIALINVLDGDALNAADVGRQLVSIFAPQLALHTTGQQEPTRLEALPEGLGRFTSGAPAPPEDNAKLRREERREQVRFAAREVFLGSGLAGARTKDIAARAGITEAFLFRLFDSKEQLFTESMRGPLEQGYVEYAAQVQTLAQRCSGQEFRDGLMEIGLAFFLVYGQMTAVVLFSELGEGRRFYREKVVPHLADIGALVMSQSGVQDPGIDSYTVQCAIFGVQWVSTFDQSLGQRPADLRLLAHRLSTLFPVGDGRSADPRAAPGDQPDI
jgi:AcrR family transcriptional regulator